MFDSEALVSTPSRSSALSRLDELAETANREHEAVSRAFRSGLEHALAAGEALTEAKRSLRTSSAWMKWIGENVSYHYVTATLYIRIWHYRAEIAECKSVADARGLLRRENLTVPGLLDKREVARVLERVAAGERPADVAREVGITRQAVNHHLHKARRASRAERERVRRERERRALARRRVKKGSAAAELYAMAERMQDLLGQARDESTSAAQRTAFDAAGEHYRQMRDEIVRAVLSL